MIKHILNKENFYYFFSFIKGIKILIYFSLFFLIIYIKLLGFYSNELKMIF